MRYRALLTGEPTAWMTYVRGLGAARARTISEAEAHTRALIRKWTGDPDPHLDLVIDCDAFEAALPNQQVESTFTAYGLRLRRSVPKARSGQISDRQRA